MAGPALEIAPPVREKRQGGIETVATFRPNDRLGTADSVVFQSDGCNFAQTEESRCYTEDLPDKSFAGIANLDAIVDPFAIYAGVKCFMGPTDTEFATRAQNALEVGRGPVLEAKLAAWAADADDLAGGGSLQQALARVEQHMDNNYVGRGVILISRYDAIMLGALKQDLPEIQTNVGSHVIASGQVSPGTVHGLGAVVVEYQSLDTRRVIDPKNNRTWALAEEVAVIAVDCEYRIKSTTTS